MLRAHHEPVGGIRKVGRAPKLYEPTDAWARISIPAREHDQLADIPIDALLIENHCKTGHEAA